MIANESYFERRVTLDDFNETESDPPPDPASQRRRIVDGATFVNDVPESVPSLWGNDSGIAWASGEGLMVVGPDGVGKTSLVQQLQLHRIGIRKGPLLVWTSKRSGDVLCTSPRTGRGRQRVRYESDPSRRRAACAGARRRCRRTTRPPSRRRAGLPAELSVESDRTW